MVLSAIWQSCAIAVATRYARRYTTMCKAQKRNLFAKCTEQIILLIFKN